MRRKEHGNFFFFPPPSGAWLETWSPKATGCVHKERRKDGTVGGRGRRRRATVPSPDGASLASLSARFARPSLARFFHKRSNCFAECMTDKRERKVSRAGAIFSTLGLRSHVAQRHMSEVWLSRIWVSEWAFSFRFVRLLSLLKLVSCSLNRERLRECRVLDF